MKLRFPGFFKAPKEAPSVYAPDIFPEPDDEPETSDPLADEDLADDEADAAAAIAPAQQRYVFQRKDRLVAAVLAAFFGVFGIHKFYLGRPAAGFLMMGVSVLVGLASFGLATVAMAVLGLSEAFVYLLCSQSEFEFRYVVGRRIWL